MTELPLIGDYSTPTTPLSGARIGVITFPGTLDDVDALRAVRLAGAEPVSLWHALSPYTHLTLPTKRIV